MSTHQSTLYRLRLAKGRLEDCARHVGVSTSCIAYWEKMVSEPKREYRKRYADYLGVSLPALGGIIYSESLVTRSAVDNPRKGGRK